MAGQQAVPERLEHQPALDGLRALAVLLVIFFHLTVNDLSWGHFFRGGFLGVDLFFVLSGFLITSLLLIDHGRSGSTISRRFWIRRARRLIPALLVLLVIASLYAVFVARPYELQDIRGQGVATLLYVENWYYLFAKTDLTLISQTWSLSIEEQWYLLWPLLLGGVLALAKGSRRYVRNAIVVLTLLSAACMAFWFATDGPLRSYYGTDSRAAELLLGALLGYLFLGRPALLRRAAAWADVVGLLSIALILVTVTQVDKEDAWLYYGGFVLIAVACCAVITAAFQPESRVVRPMLSWRPLTSIGLISYGLYLYHPPVYYWATPARVGVDGNWLLVIRLAITFALAIASYVLIEQPIRRGTFPRTRYAWAAIPTVLVGVVVALVVSTAGYVPLGDLQANQKRLAYIASTAPAGSTRVLMAGEGDVYRILSTTGGQFDGHDISSVAVATIYCDLLAGDRIVDGQVSTPPPCPSWHPLFRSGVAGFEPEVSVLMTGARDTADRMIDGRRVDVGTPEMAAAVRRELDDARRILTAGGARLLLISTLCPARAGSGKPGGPTVAEARARQAWLDGVWQSFAGEHPDSVRLLDARRILCPAGQAKVGEGTETPATVERFWRWLAPIARDEAQRAGDVAQNERG